MKLVKEISSYSDALAFMCEVEAMEESDLPSSIKFSGEMATLNMHFDGKAYNASLPGNCIRGLAEYQQCLYKAIAFCLYGDDDIRRLTRDDIRQYELVFNVGEGSTELTAAIGEMVGGLAEGFKTMDSKHKLIAIISVCLILGLGWSATTVIESKEATSREQIKATVTTSLDSEKTRQFQVFADAIRDNKSVEKFYTYTNEGTRAVLKGAADADSVTIGKVKFDKDEIESVGQRSAKEPSRAEIVTESFVILQIGTRDSGVTKFTLSRKDGTEFTALMQDSDFDENDLKSLWHHVRTRKPIELEVNITKSRQTIRAAQILSVIQKPN